MKQRYELVHEVAMPKQKATPKNLATVMIKLSAFAIDGGTDAKKAFCDMLNQFLDSLANEDAFGTEGQCDPRGDQRD